MRYKINYACISHVGLVRKTNEDNFVIGKRYMNVDNNGSKGVVSGQFSPDKEPVIVGVFDGIGGEECGETAAWLAAKSFANYNLSEHTYSLEQLCRRVNRRLSQYAYDNSILATGTTANLLLLDDAITSANLGDSRTYCITDSEMIQLSVDQVAPSRNGRKGLLTQYLGASEEELHVVPHMAHRKPQDGDIYLLCTDGLTDMISEAAISQTVRQHLSNADKQNPSGALEAAAKALLDQALKAGGRDNITLILCQVVVLRRGLFGLFGGRQG